MCVTVISDKKILLCQDALYCYAGTEGNMVFAFKAMRNSKFKKIVVFALPPAVEKILNDKNLTQHIAEEGIKLTLVILSVGKNTMQINATFTKWLTTIQTRTTFAAIANVLKKRGITILNAAA